MECGGADNPIPTRHDIRIRMLFVNGELGERRNRHYNICMYVQEDKAQECVQNLCFLPPHLIFTYFQFRVLGRR